MPVEAFRSRIGSALANRDFAEVEAAWREYASLHPEDYEYLLQIAGQLSRQDKHAVAGELCLTLSQSLLEKGQDEAAFEAARASLKGSQRTDGLRELLVSVYSAKHADNIHLDRFFDKSGLMEESGGLRQQVDALDRYLTFAEGAYVFHRGGWGYGVVAEFDPDEERMVVDFQKKPGHRIGIINATKILERLPDDHIGVYKYYRREELGTLIKEEPARVFHLFLESHGGKATLKQVREELVPEVLNKIDWSKWWGRAKKALLKDPEIRIGKGSSPLLELREEAKTIEQEVADRMAERATGTERVAVAREYLRTLDLTPQLAQAIGTQLADTLKGEESPSGRLALLYLQADLKAEGAEEAANEATRLLGAADDLVSLLGPLEPADRKRAVQELIAGSVPGWAEQVAAVLRSGDAEIADTALEHLRYHRPDILIALFAELSASPQHNPAMFLWYVRGLLHGTIPVELAPGEKDTTVMEKLLTLADQVGLEQKRHGDARLKEFLRHVRSFFTSRRLKTFKAFVEKTSLSYARYLFAKVQRNRGFTDQTKQALLDVIEAKHPDIRTAPEEERHEEVVPAADVIYTTLRGYHRREKELKQIIEVEVPKNAEDLGRAASFGDISDNAEYNAALERQDQLMRRVRHLRDDLDKARILDLDLVTTDRVVVGTRVRLTNLTRGREESYALLGPWDTDVEKGVISYLSPVGRGLLGKPTGGRADIQLPEGSVSYEVLAIEIVPPEMLEDEETALGI
ncbi:MAG: GreA/GreB family elongation factor [Planctomycetota bacterium]|jgi:transcription elongation factor GreA